MVDIRKPLNLLLDFVEQPHHHPESRVQNREALLGNLQKLKPIVTRLGLWGKILARNEQSMQASSRVVRSAH